MFSYENQTCYVSPNFNSWEPSSPNYIKIFIGQCVFYISHTQNYPSHSLVKIDPVANSTWTPLARYWRRARKSFNLSSSDFRKFSSWRPTAWNANIKHSTWGKMYNLYLKHYKTIFMDFFMDYLPWWIPGLELQRVLHPRWQAVEACSRSTDWRCWMQLC